MESQKMRINYGIEDMRVGVSSVSKAGILFILQPESLAKPNHQQIKKILKDANERLSWGRGEDNHLMPRSIFFPLKETGRLRSFPTITEYVEYLEAEDKKQTLKDQLTQVVNYICNIRKQFLPNVSAVQPIIISSISNPIGERKSINHQ